MLEEGLEVISNSLTGKEVTNSDIFFKSDLNDKNIRRNFKDEIVGVFCFCQNITEMLTNRDLLVKETTRANAEQGSF
eukprot:Pgem_evm1s20281